jgi:multidrug efflux pump subunit AcrA (membrane-fusion protein)
VKNHYKKKNFGVIKFVSLPLKFKIAIVTLLAVSCIVYLLSSTILNQRPVPSTDQGLAQAHGVGAEVTLPTKRTKVVALGRLQPWGEVINVGAPEGDRLVRLLLAEGQQAQAGDVLAYLESYTERLAEKHYIASRLVEAKARLTAETSYGNVRGGVSHCAGFGPAWSL